MLPSLRWTSIRNAKLSDLVKLLKGLKSLRVKTPSLFKTVSAKRLITVDIDDSAIRVLQIRGLNVEKWATIPLEPGNRGKELSPAPGLLASKIREAFRTNGIKGKRVIAGLSGLYTVTRVVTVPYHTRETLTERTVVDAVKSLMPLDVSDLYISWQLIANKEEGHQIIVTGIPKDILDYEAQAFKEAAIFPSMMDLRPMAIARLAGADEAIILNLDQSSYDVIIVTGGIPEIIFTSSWQPDSLSLDDRTSRLSDAVERAVAFYNSQHASAYLGASIPTFITGTLSGDLGLVEKLESRMGITATKLKPPFVYPDKMPVDEYTVNLGLALKDRSFQKNKTRSALKTNINYLPPVYRTLRLSPVAIMFVTATLLALAGIISMTRLTTDMMSRTANLDVRQQLLNAELQRRQTEIKNRLPLQRTIDSFNSMAKMDGDYASDIRFIFDMAIENNIQVSSVHHEVDSINITCESDADVSFRNFLSALGESKRFISISPPPEGYPYSTGGVVIISMKSSTKPATKSGK